MNSPFVMVIFGATGDLARNKLFPALYSLYKKGELGEQFFIVGFSRKNHTHEEFQTLIKKEIYFDDSNHRSNWERFTSNIYYQQGLFEKKNGYKKLIQKLNAFDKKIGACITRLFYLATPPDNYQTILDYLSSTKLSEGCGPYFAKATQGKQGMAYLLTRLIIEKPFGKDLETARKLDTKIAHIFDEKQIFRVDHYLGKETVQNMIAFRFANGIFEPVWNRKYIDHVQITWAEQKGIGQRGTFFDGIGILRDVGQNHLMQLVATIAMEQPKTFSKEGVRDARAAAIQAIRYISPEETSQHVIRGQYTGYTQEKNVAKDSTTETFIAAKLFVNTDRFASIPFYVRAGKAMPKDTVEISIVFIQTCHVLFKEIGCPEEGNVLTIRIQPDEGITLRVIAKKPHFVSLSGTSRDKPGSYLTTVDMGFSYKEEFGKSIDNAYEKLLMDIFAGDQMLFNRSDELESSWGLITKILEGWKSQKSRIVHYEPGTWGPKEADDLIAKDGKKWI